MIIYLLLGGDTIIKPINYITFLFPLRNTISNCNCLSVLIICF